MYYKQFKVCTLFSVLLLSSELASERMCE